jgi:predicted O-methyltransferase YrrM
MEFITYDAIEAYITSHLNPYPSPLPEMEQTARERYIPIVQPETARLLALLAQISQPKSLLEIGTAIGYSALVFAGVLPGVPISTLERDKNIIREAQEWIGRAGKQEQISIVEGDAMELLPQFVQEGRQYDFLFLDAAKGHYSRMLPYLIDLLPPKGVLVCDNVLSRGMVSMPDEAIPRDNRTIARRLREFHDMLKDCPELDTAVIPIGDGISLSRKKEVIIHE